MLQERTNSEPETLQQRSNSERRSGMDWLEFRPWSREVERFCRTCLDEASRQPHQPVTPPHAPPRELMREYGKACEALVDLPGDDDVPPQRLA
jgi:hypothetical protein